MATTLSGMKRRIRTTTQIRKVTATLQKVASAKLAQDLKRIENSSVYFNGICRLLRAAHESRPSGEPPHPLMRTQPGNTICLVVFGSDRGLCGAFNTMLMKAITSFRNAHPNQTVRLLLSGKVVYRRALRQKWAPLESITGTAVIEERLLADFLNHTISEVHILYWRYKTGFDQHIVTEQVLPTPFTTTMDMASAPALPFDAHAIEPSPSAIIDALLPEYVRCSIYNGFTHSAVTENAQRRASMRRATENAGEMLTDLRKTYSRLRQESITTEMLEIVSGMQA